MKYDNAIEMQKNFLAIKNTTLTAGATVTATGEIVDRFGTYTDPDGDFDLKYDLNDINAVLGLDGAVADTETLNIKVYLQTSDSSTFASDVNYVNAEGDLSAAIPTTGYGSYDFTGATAVAVTFDDIVDLKAYIAGCKRYLRLAVVATFSATGTDNVILMGSASLGNSQNNVIDTVDITGVVAE